MQMKEMFFGHKELTIEFPIFRKEVLPPENDVILHIQSLENSDFS